MNYMPTNLLALFARRKELGFALMDNGEIYRYGVKRIRAKGSGHVFVEAVVKSFSPLLELMGTEGVVVIEAVSASRKPPKPKADIPHLVKRFVEGIYPVMEIPLSDVKRFWCGEPNITHRALALAIVQRYPVLESVISGAKAYKARYWEKAVIAVGLAEVAKGRLEGEDKKIPQR